MSDEPQDEIRMEPDHEFEKKAFLAEFFRKCSRQDEDSTLDSSIPAKSYCFNCGTEYFGRKYLPRMVYSKGKTYPRPPPKVSPICVVIYCLECNLISRHVEPSPPSPKAPPYTRPGGSPGSPGSRSRR